MSQIKTVSHTPAQSAVRRGVTLIEILIVVSILGITGRMVIPAMNSVGVLRIQAAVRTLVSDITFIQSEALANQSRYVMVFGQVATQDTDGAWTMGNGNGYTIFAPPPGAAAINITSTVDVVFDPSDHGRPLSRNFNDNQFGGATINNAAFDGSVRLIFDELGGPALDLTTDQPSAGGAVEVSGTDSTFRVTVDAFTGRVEVARIN